MRDDRSPEGQGAVMFSRDWTLIQGPALASAVPDYRFSFDDVEFVIFASGAGISCRTKYPGRKVTPGTIILALAVELARTANATETK